jgi:hypothetical protein
MKKKLTYSLAALALLLPSLALAETISLNLTNPVEIGLPGAELSFAGTLTAPDTNTGAEYLNGDAYTLDSALTLDDTGFWSLPVVSLNPGQSISGLLFTIDISNSAIPGIYSGNFDILGGADSDAQNLLGTIDFQVNVAPEPESVVLFATGLFGIVDILRRRKFVHHSITHQV